MITIPLISDWNICTPTVFRYLSEDYAASFFEEGKLRLSSFDQFAKHKDEQRLDIDEGRVMFVHKTAERGGQTITTWWESGHNAYVLCGTMRHSTELMNDFGSDSYIRINDTTKFGMAIAKHIPGLTKSFEGPCLYQEKKIVEKDLGWIDPNRFRDQKDPRKLNEPLMKQFVASQLQHYPYFLKDAKFAPQTEYRFLWLSSAPTNSFLDVTVPEAIKFCSRPSSLTE